MLFTSKLRTIEVTSLILLFFSSALLLIFQGTEVVESYLLFLPSLFAAVLMGCYMYRFRWPFGPFQKKEEFTLPTKELVKRTGYTESHLGSLRKTGGLEYKMRGGIYYHRPSDAKRLRKKREQVKKYTPYLLIRGKRKKNNEEDDKDKKELISAKEAEELTGEPLSKIYHSAPRYRGDENTEYSVIFDKEEVLEWSRGSNGEKSKTEDDFITTSELSSIAGVDRTKIYMASNDQLPRYRRGGGPARESCFKRDDAMKWVSTLSGSNGRSKKDEDDKKVLDKYDAAKYLDLAPNTIKDVREDVLPFVKGPVGKKYFSKNDLIKASELRKKGESIIKYTPKKEDEKKKSDLDKGLEKAVEAPHPKKGNDLNRTWVTEKEAVEKEGVNPKDLEYLRETNKIDHHRPDPKKNEVLYRIDHIRKVKQWYDNIKSLPCEEIAFMRNIPVREVKKRIPNENNIRIEHLEEIPACPELKNKWDRRKVFFSRHASVILECSVKNVGDIAYSGEVGGSKNKNGWWVFSEKDLMEVVTKGKVSPWVDLKEAKRFIGCKTQSPLNYTNGASIGITTRIRRDDQEKFYHQFNKAGLINYYLRHIKNK